MDSSQNPFAPFQRQWDGYDHYHFICWASKYYKAAKYGVGGHHFSPSFYASYRHYDRWNFFDVALRLYNIGRRHYVLDRDFESFWQQLDPIESPYRTPEYEKRLYKQKKAYKDWYPRRGAHYRQRVPLRIAEKKLWTGDMQQKHDWRERKGFSKDKARHGSYHYHTKPQRYGKQLCNRGYRRFIRDILQKEQYEKITLRKPKDWFDPWQFD